MALLDDGDELDCLCSANEEQARENHKILVDKYVDIRLNGSTYDNLLKIKKNKKGNIKITNSRHSITGVLLLCLKFGITK